MSRSKIPLRRPSGESRPDDLLDSWKEIAAYLNREIRTVQRWEKKEGLPVHRQQHEKLGSVYGYKSEIDEWWAQRSLELASKSEGDDPEESRGPQTLSWPINQNSIHEVKASPSRSRKLWVAAGWLVGSGLLLFALLVLGNAWDLRERVTTLFNAGAPQPIHSIAVLPLKNLSGDASNDYFADGVTDALITELGKVGALRVISRTSSSRYKNAKKPLSEIARELNVDGIVEGSVVQSAGRVRINAQLIYAKTDLFFWGQSYERDLGNVLTLEGELARAITREIRVSVTPQEQRRLKSTATVNPEAYQLYLKGEFFLQRRTEDGMRRAVECFEEALRKDPNSALAYSGLAASYSLLGAFNFISPKEADPKSKAAAMKALELDDTLAEAHAALADTADSFDEQERHFKRAIELNPSYATAHHWYARALSERGRMDEAIREIQRAQELDPLSLIINDNVGEVYIWARQYDEAIEQLLKTLEMEPNFARTHLDLGTAYECKGMFSQAIAEFQRARDLGGENWPELRAPLQRAYETSGYRGYYEEQLRLLKERSKKKYVAPVSIAMIYARLGDKEQSLAWLEKAYRDESGLFFIEVEPVYDSLRSDPRFRDLLRRAGLP
jgi:TolB-like protein/Flp pilus assembly protein TadD